MSVQTIHNFSRKQQPLFISSTRFQEHYLYGQKRFFVFSQKGISVGHKENNGGNNCIFISWKQKIVLAFSTNNKQIKTDETRKIIILSTTTNTSFSYYILAHSFILKIK